MTPEKLKEIVETPFWPKTIESDTPYRRQHDDTDGGEEGVLQVFFGRDGDAYISIDGSAWLRFRTYGGGGASLRTRTALLISAEAIRLDNEEWDRSQMGLFKGEPRRL